MLTYLNSLIELEFSVVKEHISNQDRVALSELEIYKNIAIYNIYNRTANLLREKNSEFIISEDNDGYESLEISTKLNETIIKLFDFNYREGPIGFNSKIPDGYKTMNIGSMSLFQTFESEELRQAELNDVIKKLERLYDASNPYPSRPGVVGGPGTNWAFDHAKKIQTLEEQFEKLDSKKELSDADKREIEITGEIHSLLLDDFGLTNESFIDENDQYLCNFGEEKTKLKKTLVKEMPNLTIKDYIKYI